MKRNTMHTIGGAIIFFLSMLIIRNMEVQNANIVWEFIFKFLISGAITFGAGYGFEVIQKHTKKGNANFKDVIRTMKGIYFGLPIYILFTLII